jgi:NADPH:quinone reductase-like Zn-dependent oxidoreductase
MSGAVAFSRYGDPGVLAFTDVETPRPGPGQVRIRVRAVSVNPIDVKIRSGMMADIMPVEFPHVPGWDVAGVVDAAGPGAGAEVGDEVFGVVSVGGYSEYALLDNPVRKPAGLPWAAAAAVVTVGEAAYRVLKHLGLTAGQTLVVLGAAGSVGTITVQLARADGLTVVGVAGQEDLERVADLGAVAVRSGDGWADRVRLAGLMDKGELQVPIGRTYPLREAASAHADLEAGRNRGKIVLLP